MRLPAFGSSAGLDACPRALLECDGEVTPDPDEVSWFDGGLGEVGTDAGAPDTASNQQWLDEVADTCSYQRYGFAVGGEPGSTRRAVVLLAE
jgi:hypothetical protein